MCGEADGVIIFVMILAADRALVNVEKLGTPFAISEADLGILTTLGETLSIASILGGRRVVQVWPMFADGLAA